MPSSLSPLLAPSFPLLPPRFYNLDYLAENKSYLPELWSQPALSPFTYPPHSIPRRPNPRSFTPPHRFPLLRPYLLPASSTFSTTYPHLSARESFSVFSPRITSVTTRIWGVPLLPVSLRSRKFDQLLIELAGFSRVPQLWRSHQDAPTIGTLWQLRIATVARSQRGTLSSRLVVAIGSIQPSFTGAVVRVSGVTKPPQPL